MRCARCARAPSRDSRKAEGGVQRNKVETAAGEQCQCYCAAVTLLIGLRHLDFGLVRRVSQAKSQQIARTLNSTIIATERYAKLSSDPKVIAQAHARQGGLLSNLKGTWDRMFGKDILGRE